MGGVRLAAAALGSGLVAGVVLDLLAFVVARYGPQGDGWSLRGNGALVVPFGLGPAVLAGAWTALVLRSRGSPRWLRWGVAAGLVGVTLNLASVAALAVPGGARQGVAQGLSLAVVAWMAAAPLLAGLLRLADAAPRQAPAAHAIGGALFASALVAGFLLADRLLPPGS